MSHLLDETQHKLKSYCRVHSKGDLYFTMFGGYIFMYLKKKMYIYIYIYMLTPPPMIHPNDGPSLLQSVWAQVQTIFYVKQTELVQKNK